VTGASEDEKLGRRRGKKTPASKNWNRPVRSAWGVVKRAMHPWDSLPRITERNVGARRRSVVGRSRSYASLVDDLLRSS
jgi:hypothetical protein